MEAASKQMKALRLVRETGDSQHRRFLDTIYGPQAKPLRQAVLSCLVGHSVNATDKRCGYGALRQLLVDAIGATGNCVAAVDADFERRMQVL